MASRKSHHLKYDENNKALIAWVNNDKIKNDKIKVSQYLNVTYLIHDPFRIPMISSVISHTA